MHAAEAHVSDQTNQASRGRHAVAPIYTLPQRSSAIYQSAQVLVCTPTFKDDPMLATAQGRPAPQGDALEEIKRRAVGCVLGLTGLRFGISQVIERWAVGCSTAGTVSNNVYLSMLPVLDVR